MHTGRIVGEKTGYKVIDCEGCGFKHLDPLPTETDMDKFYSEKYYSEGKEQGRSAMKSVMEGERREKHVQWLRETLYKDNLYFLEQYTAAVSAPKRILDVGCGAGDSLKYMEDAGWVAFGIEPSKMAFDLAKSSGLKNVFNMTLREFAGDNPHLRGYFHVVTLYGTLHHVTNPQAVLEMCKDFLMPGGLLLTIDPNEFSTFQITAQRALSKEMWWIFPPEHVNYFDFDSYERLIKKIGFEPILKTTSFPMELFLLMGDEYVGNDAIGSQCHQKRIRFELTVADEMRREIYKSINKLGIGRDCVMYARLPEKPE